MFFESAVDLLSFATIAREQKNTLKGCLLVSMAGLKAAVIGQMLEVYGGAAVPVLCVDNDEPGSEFITRTLQKYPAAMIHQPGKEYKDWNEQLVSIIDIL
jgi:hypothetical protein